MLSILTSPALKIRAILMAIVTASSLWLSGSANAQTSVAWHYGGIPIITEDNGTVTCTLVIQVWIESDFEPVTSHGITFDCVFWVDGVPVEFRHEYEPCDMDDPADGTIVFSRDPLNPTIIPIQWEVPVGPGTHSYDFEVSGAVYLGGMFMALLEQFDVLQNVNTNEGQFH